VDHTSREERHGFHPDTGAGAPPHDAGGAAEQARDKAQEVAGQAQEKAQEAASKASDRVREQVDQRSTQVGEQVAGQAGDIRSVAEQLREQGKDKPAQLAEQAADRVESVGSYLRDNDADRILHDVEDFARRQPMAVVAGGLLLGFAASRFLKASSQERYQSRGTRELQTSSARPTPALQPTGNGHSTTSL
jgi:gas vesicle protein